MICQKISEIYQGYLKDNIFIYVIAIWALAIIICIFVCSITLFIH